MKKTAEEFSMGFLGTDQIPKDLIQDDKASAKLLGVISSGKQQINKTKDTLFKLMHSEQISQEQNCPGLSSVGTKLHFFSKSIFFI